MDQTGCCQHYPMTAFLIERTGSELAVLLHFALAQRAQPSILPHTTGLFHDIPLLGGMMAVNMLKFYCESLGK
jgi:hypothetical protein